MKCFRHLKIEHFAAKILPHLIVAILKSNSDLPVLKIAKTVTNQIKSNQRFGVDFRFHC